MNDLALQLQRPFPPDVVSWRIDGKPINTRAGPKIRLVCYLTKSDVQDRLDEAFGPLGWASSYTFSGAAILCTIGCLKLPAEETLGSPSFWPAKTDGGEKTQIEAVKGGLSDAFKRSAMAWGVGRYLNRIKNTEVELTEGYDQGGKLNVKLVKEGDRWVLFNWKEHKGERGTWHTCKPPTRLLPDEDSNPEKWAAIAETARSDMGER